MGRRAKNKQGPPAPHFDKNEERQSPKKLGKRKALPEDINEKRPKKTRAHRDSVGKDASLGVKKGMKVDKAKKKSKPLDEEAGSSDRGWEDVEDDADLKTQARYTDCFNRVYYGCWLMDATDLCSTAAT